jgi:putative RNA 2'-phosphotransferase
MLSKEETTRISKQLSYVLRHNPGAIGIRLDEQGWTAVEELIEKMQKNEPAFNVKILKHIVDTNSKKRFAFNEDGTRIRASQGHSVEVDLNYTESLPPDYLFHGTTGKHMSSILKEGLQRMNSIMYTCLQMSKRREL